MKGDETKYFSISEESDIITLSTKHRFVWIEIIIFTIPFTILAFFLGGFIISFCLTLFVSSLYSLFRFFSYYYYSNINFNKQTNELIIKKYFFNNLKDEQVIEKSVQVNKFDFEKLERSGKIKYLLNYKSYKKHELIIVKSEEDKNYITENFINQMSS